MNSLYSELISRLIEDAGSSPDRWAELIKMLGTLHSSAVPRIIVGLADTETETWTDPQRMAIWEAIRHTLSRHRGFPDADWAMPSEVLDQLAGVYPRFEPRNTILRVSWLFGDRAELPEGLPQDWEERESRLSRLRAEAVAAVFEDGGLDGVLRLAHAVQDPWMVGIALLDSHVVPDALSGLTVLAQVHDSLARQVARAVLLRGAETDGDETIRAVWEHEAVKALPLDWRVLVLLASPFDQGTWDLLADADLANLYWAEVVLYGRGALDARTVESAAAGLRAASQYARAIDFLAIYREHAPPVLTLEILEGALSSEQAGGKRSRSVRVVDLTGGG